MTHRVVAGLVLAAALAAPSAAEAGEGPMHATYENKLTARRPGLYFRLTSHFARGTPMTGPIPAPSNVNPRSKYYGHGVPASSLRP